MDGFEALLANRVLLAALTGWFVAQVFKVILTFIIHKRWDFSRMFGSGGMPSSHSSFICALATSVGISRGFQSVEFAISVALALIVMYDAAGVRRSAGKQAAAVADPSAKSDKSETAEPAPVAPAVAAPETE